MSESSVPNSSPPRLGDDGGFMLVEVLVSILILVMASLAVFSTLEQADKAAGNQQRRALAANWAQSELERIRSLPVEDIAAMRGTRTVTRDKIDYYITTTAKWVSDGDDEPQCTSRSGGLDYMRTTVSIGWEGMGQSKPISFTSLFTPSAGAGGDTGSVSVRLINRNAGPVAGVPITLDGPSNYTETTNKNGCVVFAFVPESLDYTVRFSRAGYVDEQSDNIVQSPTTVTAKETTKLEFLYDSAGYTRANFITQTAATPLSNPPTGPSSPPSIQMFHAEQRQPGVTVPITTGSTWDGAGRGFFPFTSPYAIYAGNCPKNVPVAGDWASYLVNITPLATQNVGTMQLPALDVTVMDKTAATGGVGVAAKVEIESDCNVKWVRYTNNSGKLDDRGVPWSAVTRVCATINGSGGPRRVVVKNPVSTKLRWNTVPIIYYTGDSNNNLNPPKSGTSASCFD